MAWPARWPHSSRASGAWSFTRCRGWPRRWTGPDRSRRSAPPASTPSWWTRRSARRSSSRRSLSGFVIRCPRWSRRHGVPEGPDLLSRLGAFARLLHDAGLEAGPRRLTDATRALTFVDLKKEPDFRNALRAVFVSRKEDLPTFEAAFDIFWAPPDPRAAAGVIPGRAGAAVWPQAANAAARHRPGVRRQRCDGALFAAADDLRPRDRAPGGPGGIRVLHSAHAHRGSAPPTRHRSRSYLGQQGRSRLQRRHSHRRRARRLQPALGAARPGPRRGGDHRQRRLGPWRS